MHPSKLQVRMDERIDGLLTDNKGKTRPDQTNRNQCNPGMGRLHSTPVHQTDQEGRRRFSGGREEQAGGVVRCRVVVHRRSPAEAGVWEVVTPAAYLPRPPIRPQSASTLPAFPPLRRCGIGFGSSSVSRGRRRVARRNPEGEREASELGVSC